MTDETFTELVNLYLDGEISETDLTRLKKELAINTRRRQLFAERNRLHRAMRLALNPQTVDRKRSGGFPRFSRWFMGTGLAASLVLGWVLFSPVLLDHGGNTSLSIETGQAGASEQDWLEQILSDWSSEADLKRYASRQQRGLPNERASLAAQLRLMGLRPELTPQDKEFRPIDTAAHQSEPTRNQAELLNDLQRHALMPKTRILRSDANRSNYAEHAFTSYRSGFEASLTSFK